MAEAQGWTVRRIKIDDGCYEIDGRDAKGRTFKVTVDPGTLAIIGFKHEDDDGQRGAAPAEHGDGGGTLGGRRIVPGADHEEDQ
jgi:hypothetical protein